MMHGTMKITNLHTVTSCWILLI